ncbi:hypothetical protein [Hyphomicrobium sp.]|uniref:hypothetical protein n=1 Tax=Hyphomicrobium sp. TaxID=82 RepID=UPI0025C44430|nr:hypothetical protein [Hyphomicrobium sp.]
MTSALHIRATGFKGKRRDALRFWQIPSARTALPPDSGARSSVRMLAAATRTKE